MPTSKQQDSTRQQTGDVGERTQSDQLRSQGREKEGGTGAGGGTERKGEGVRQPPGERGTQPGRQGGQSAQPKRDPQPSDPGEQDETLAETEQDQQEDEEV